MKFRRTILKQELAVKLYPDSNNPNAAMQLLRKEIRNTPTLKTKLYQENQTNYSHSFSHKQLKLLLEHYCISTEEFEKL